jgi:hypothetical protein
MIIFDSKCKKSDLSELHPLHFASLNLLSQILEFYNHDAVVYDYSRYESIVFPRTMQLRGTGAEKTAYSKYGDFLSFQATDNVVRMMNMIVSRKQAKGWVLEWVRDVGEYNYKRYFKIYIAPKPSKTPYRRLDRLDLIDFQEPYEFLDKQGGE